MSHYTHIQYENDGINFLDNFTRTPHDSDAFENITLELPDEDGGPGGHRRIAQGSETNMPGIRATVRQLKD